MTAREKLVEAVAGSSLAAPVVRRIAEERANRLVAELRAEVLTEAADLLQATLAELQPGMPADLALAPGLGVAEGLIRRMAAPTTTQEQ